MATPQRRRLLLASQAPITYLLGPFRFGTDQAAPLTSPYTEAGVPGSLTLVQNDGTFAISGGRLRYTAQATPAWGDQNIYDPTGIARATGRAFIITAQVTNLISHVFPLHLARIQGAINPTLAPSFAYAYRVQAVQRFDPAVLASGAIAFPNGEAVGNATDYDLAIVMRSTGAFFLIKGGAFTNWTLSWVDVSGTDATLYVGVHSFSAAGQADNLRVTDLGGGWSTDYGIATQRLAGARTANDAFAHTANALLEFTVTTLPSAGSIDYEFRRQDVSNKWIARVSTTGALSLIEVVAGVETSRASAAGVISNGHRVVVVADGTTIAGYSNNASRWSYASASNFAAQGSGLLGSLGTGGAVSDIVAWPRTVMLPGGV
jgi:hypothetical protein